MARNRDEEARARNDEVARWRLAAESTLEQLEWCVGYLHRIRKSPIADALDKNRRHILRQARRTGG
jgi:hypothetical protein